MTLMKTSHPIANFHFTFCIRNILEAAFTPFTLIGAHQFILKSRKVSYQHGKLFRCKRYYF